MAKKTNGETAPAAESLENEQTGDSDGVQVVTAGDGDQVDVGAENLQLSPEETMAKIQQATSEIIANNTSAGMKPTDFDPQMLQNISTGPVVAATPSAQGTGATPAHPAVMAAAQMAALDNPAIDPVTRATLESIANATQMKTQDTPTSLQGAGQRIMPASVRDIPNKLDMGKQKLLILNLFGAPKEDRAVDPVELDRSNESLGEAVLDIAARFGFDQKPAVWVSQKLWELLQGDGANPVFPGVGIPAHPEMDAKGGVVDAALQQFLEPSTIRDLERLAQYSGQSHLGAIRSIFANLIKEHRDLQRRRGLGLAK